MSGRLLSWVGDFLQDRQVCVRFQGHLSERFQFELGTPLLFNILAERLTSVPTCPGVRLLCYADDIALVATGRNQVRGAQETLRPLSERCTELGLTINPTKSSAMAFHYGPKPQQLLLQGRPLPWTTTHRYLGYVLD